MGNCLFWVFRVGLGFVLVSGGLGVSVSLVCGLNASFGLFISVYCVFAG